jgi:hypothetical protein
MPARKYKPVAVEPLRIGGIEFQLPHPQSVRRRRQTHRHTGMPGFRLLHSVRCQKSYRINAKLIELVHAFYSYRFTHLNFPENNS